MSILVRVLSHFLLIQLDIESKNILLELPQNLSEDLPNERFGEGAGGPRLERGEAILQKRKLPPPSLLSFLETLNRFN